MDRSRYKNPEAPPGWVRPEPRPRLMHKYGRDINGEHLVLTDLIWRVKAWTRPDYDTLDQVIFSSDDECTVKDPAKSTIEEECITVPLDSIKKEKVTIKQELGEDGISEKGAVSKHRKKGHDSDSELEASVSHMHISREKRKKRLSSSRRKHDHHVSSSSQAKLVKYSSSSSPSPSPPPQRSPDQYLDVKVKEEPFDQPQHLFGRYHCDDCNITMNSLLTYNTHMNGKRHRKSLKLKNVSAVVAQSIPATVVSDDLSKYPLPRSGIIRKKVQTPAIIQNLIEAEVKVPCPGLNKVIEIQGIECVQYYCDMCNSVCSSNSIIPHITGFKHQLKTLKEFKPGDYEFMNFLPKYKIEQDLLSLLRSVQKQEGIGRMAVEVEELISEPNDRPLGRPSTSRDYFSQPSTSRVKDDHPRPSTSRDYCSQPSTSRVKDNYSRPSTSRDYFSQPSTSREMGRENLGMSFHEIYDKATIPDKLASDFYCDVCDSHMNSLQMWESHIRGKRHVTNLKKFPGDRPSKNKTILVPNRRARLLDRLEQEYPHEPAVGLREIRETEIYETGSQSYQCFLCGSCHTAMDIVEHVISLKHRTKYLDHINYAEKMVIAGMSDSAAASLVKEMCIEVERKEGRDKVPVYINKSSIYR